MATPTRIKDINPGQASSWPEWLGAASGKFYFAATTEGQGRELWLTDGTEAGTALVKDIFPGAQNGLHFYPAGLAEALGSNVYFSASDGVNGFELWKSDGTAAGTVLVKDIATGSYTYPSGEVVPYSSDPDFNAASTGARLFFTATGPEGAELWTSDGTETGTVAFDINPGVYGSYATDLVRIGDVVYFTADDGTHGRELWKSDGTAPGIVLVKDINQVASAIPGSTLSSNPQVLLASGSKLYFAADDGVSGSELWVSDGTDGGTSLVKDINPGVAGSLPGEMLDLGGIVYFSADDGVGGDELWRTDGTAAGTTLVKDIVPGLLGSNIAELTAVGSKFFFVADTGEGRELWVSDGTELGTTLLKDIFPGASVLPQDAPQNLTAFDGKLYFSANDGVSGRELWVSDGTALGTARVADINLGGGSSDPGYLYVVGNTLYFSADDGVSGQELWSITANSAPTDLAVSASSFDENLPAATSVARFTSLDPNAGDAHVYSLVAGEGDADNAAFAIINDQLQINVSPDFEAKSQYSIRVRTTDSGGLSFEKPLTFAVNDLGEAPAPAPDPAPVVPGPAPAPSSSGGGAIAPVTAPVVSRAPVAAPIQEPLSDTVLIGDDQSNRLEPASQGSYRMTGKGGADVFSRCILEPFARDNVDIITDFNSAEGDSIGVCKDAFPGISAIKFKSVSSRKRFANAQSSRATIIYSERKGELYFNSNGAQRGLGEDGGIFMILENKPDLVAADFSLI